MRAVVVVFCVVIGATSADANFTGVGPAAGRIVPAGETVPSIQIAARKSRNNGSCWRTMKSGAKVNFCR
jgi:hypothetical protein